MVKLGYVSGKILNQKFVTDLCLEPCLQQRKSPLRTAGFLWVGF